MVVLCNHWAKVPDEMEGGREKAGSMREHTMIPSSPRMGPMTTGPGPVALTWVQAPQWDG